MKTAVVAGIFALCALPTTIWASQGSEENDRQPPVNWHGCRTGPADELGAALDDAGAQCGQVRVPVDYGHPHGRTITVAFARIKATDPAKRRGVLLVNPGGPGASARRLRAGRGGARTRRAVPDPG